MLEEIDKQTYGMNLSIYLLSLRSNPIVFSYEVHLLDYLQWDIIG